MVGLLTFQLNAKNALRGSSRWGACLGDAVAHSSLTVVDDGRLLGGVASGSFDREGAPRKKLTLIGNGKIEAFLHNTYTSHAMQTAESSNASGSARSVPGIGPSNFLIEPGTHTRSELIGDIKQGLLVNRFSGTSNPISGDFSGVAKAAYVIKNGRIDRPVTGTLVAGNIFECLQSLSGISSETERVSSTILPYVRLEGVSVTAE
ncbi:metallopeptidase TldD-related protein [Candidatus Bipolaricaulota bacterium]